MNQTTTIRSCHLLTDLLLVAAKRMDAQDAADVVGIDVVSCTERVSLVYKLFYLYLSIAFAREEVALKNSVIAVANDLAQSINK